MEILGDLHTYPCTRKMLTFWYTGYDGIVSNCLNLYSMNRKQGLFRLTSALLSPNKCNQYNYKFIRTP